MAKIITVAAGRNCPRLLPNDRTSDCYPAGCVACERCPYNKGFDTMAVSKQFGKLTITYPADIVKCEVEQSA